MCHGKPRNFAAVLRRRSLAAGKLLAGAALALGLTPLAAQNQKERAVDAAFADGVTTAVGVAAAGGAINPVGALLVTAMKAFTLERASKLPETEQPEAYAAASAMWMGGTVSNVCITAVLLTGGGFAPACFALGAAWGLKTWHDSEHERRFWERCAIVRQFAERQQIKCVYKPPGQQPAVLEASASSVGEEKAEAAMAPIELAREEPASVPPPLLAGTQEVEAP